QCGQCHVAGNATSAIEISHSHNQTPENVANSENRYGILADSLASVAALDIRAKSTRTHIIASRTSFAVKGKLMSDRTTTLSDLRQLIANFVAARDWQQFHSPKNLSMSLAIEAAELMEHFQWLTIEQSRAIPSQPEKLTEVSDELADILCYALALANELR